MQAKKMHTLSRERFVDTVVQLFKEGLILLAVGFSAFILLILLTFDPGDPGWSHLGWNPEIKNSGGIWGAWLADLMFSVVGVGAFMLPVLFSMKAYWVVKFWYRPSWYSLGILLIRLLGLICLVISASVLASFHLDPTTLHYPYTAGGLVGQNLAPYVLKALKLEGGSLVMTFVFFIGISLFTNLSLLQVAEWIGRQLCWIWDKTAAVRAERAEKNRRKDDFAPLPLAGEPVSARGAKEDSRTVTKSPARAGQQRIEPDFAEFLANARAQHKNTTADTSKKPAAPADSTLSDASRMTDRTDTGQENIDRFSSQEQFKPGNANAVRGSADDDLPILDHVIEPHSSPSVHFQNDSAGEGRAEEHWAGTHQLEIDDDDLPWDEPSPVNPQGQPYGVQLNAADDEHHYHRDSQPAPVMKTGIEVQPLGKQMLPDEEDLDAPSRSVIPRRPALSALPSLDVLDPADENKGPGYSPERLQELSGLLESKLLDFGVKAQVVAVNPGPVITRFEVQPAPGVKASKITNLSRDLARSLAVMSVRVVEVIPGKSVIGLEIPNERRATVRLSEVLKADTYQQTKSPLPLALGHDIGGFPVVANLAKMPHLLVAGTTGSGKSVGVNAMILSLLFKCTPEQVRLIMVDPKMLELSIYDGIPHLLCPVITDMKEAAGALRWCVGEMERRYQLMASVGVRNLEGFNRKLEESAERGEYFPDPLWKAEQSFEPVAPNLEPLPYIVVIIDEFADMMMMVGKKVEELIARIAQKARAAGIHLILATQRPSVDVITGLIKANVPSRIAFQVSSKIDSRTILDQGGAESLLGNGDMLYMPVGTNLPTRVHGAFVDDDEVHRLVEEWKQRGTPDYIEDILNTPEEGSGPVDTGGNYEEEQDPLYDEAVAFVLETGRVSISSVQRKLKIGYNRAARMVEAMESAGLISAPNHNGTRDILAPNSTRDY
ncbi:DNA translocase FtsK [Pokkaliibacter plantistimulans]